MPSISPSSRLLGAAAAYVIVLFGLPLASLLVLAGNWQTYAGVLADDHNWQILGTTFQLALLVTVFSLLIGYPVAFRARTAGPRMRAIILGCATIPMWMSLLARSYAWISVLDRRGLVNAVLLHLGLIDRPLRLLHTTGASIIGSVYIMVPLMVLTLYAQMSAIDFSLVRAARTLGARPSQAFVRVFLPLSLNGVVAGSLLVFIVSLGLFVTPALLGGPADRTFSMLIDLQVDTFGDFATAGALSLLLLVAALVMVALFFKLSGGELAGGRKAPGRAAMGSATTRMLRRVAWCLPVLESPLLWNGLIGLVMVFLFLPLFTLIAQSFGDSAYLQFPPEHLSLRWYAALLDDPKWAAAARHSLLVGAIATTLACVIGLAAALGLTGARDSAGRRAIYFILLAPSLVPPMVYALAAFYTGSAVGLTDTIVGLGLAHSVLALPFVVVILQSGLREIGPDIDRAARSLGAGGWQRLRRITLPLLSRSLAVAALVAFQTSFDEIVVALFVSGVDSRTVPKVLWQSAILEVTPIVPAAAVTILAVGLSGALLAVAFSAAVRIQASPVKRTA